MEQKLEKSLLTLSDKVILLLYALFFILKPFYFWSSGLPQISDIIMILLIAIYIFKREMIIQLNSHSKKFASVALMFMLYVLFANTIWMLILSGPLNFFITSAFYVYNFLVSLIVAGLYFDFKEKLVEITYNSTLASVIIQLFIYMLGGGFSGERIKGGFNNPNQLGYYSLLTLAILLFTSQKIKVKIKWFILGVFSSGILCFSSLSKAAILSYVGILLFFILSKNKNYKLKRILIIILLILTIIFISIYTFNSELITSNSLYSSVQFRLSSIGRDNDDSLAARGYSRLIEYPEYWFFGAGEGEYYRFTGADIEVHSTLGNIQSSYGIVGSVLFIWLLYLAIREGRYKNWYIVTFILIYGLTHNGIRNSLFWILLTLLTGVYEETTGLGKEVLSNE